MSTLNVYLHGRMVGTRFISDLENGKGTIQIQKLLDVLNALGLGLYIFNRWEND